MKRLRTVVLAVAAVAAFVLLPRTARTDAWNKKTFVTFPEAIETPGGVLPPGKYVFKLADSLSNRNIVQIFNERENHVEATVLAIPKYREKPADKTIFTFYEMPRGEPQAIRSWFYPGDTSGQEFTYPKGRATQIAALTREQVPTSLNTTEAPPPPPAPASEPQAEAPAAPPANAEASNNPAPQEPVELAQNQPQEQPSPIAPAAQQPAQEEKAPETTMPKTASVWPLVALLGFSSLAAALLLRAVARRSA